MNSLRRSRCLGTQVDVSDTAAQWSLLATQRIGSKHHGNVFPIYKKNGELSKEELGHGKHLRINLVDVLIGESECCPRVNMFLLSLGRGSEKIVGWTPYICQTVITRGSSVVLMYRSRRVHTPEQWLRFLRRFFRISQGYTWFCVDSPLRGSAKQLGS